MKQLTVAVPSYNSETFLGNCLGSFLYSDGSADERLEVLIINDGSTDGTADVAAEWVQKYPDVFRLINKENGGHGSGINAGISGASGRYFKVVDSDDRIESESLFDLLNALEKTEADVVVTGYVTVNEASGVKHKYASGTALKRASADETSLSEFMADYENSPAAMSFHGLMYNTEFYKSTQIRMSEGVYFEDQEYAILPFAHVKTVLRLPLFFYEYSIGREDQSVNFENQAKRADQFLQVVTRMSEYHGKCEGLDSAQNDFLIRRLSNAAVSYYATVLVKSKIPAKNETSEKLAGISTSGASAELAGSASNEVSAKRGSAANGRKKAAEFRQYLKENEPEVFKRTKTKYEMMLVLGMIPGAAALYGKLFDSKAYALFKARWVK